jgi:hypothetical protein
MSWSMFDKVPRSYHEHGHVRDGQPKLAVVIPDFQRDNIILALNISRASPIDVPNSNVSR